MNLLIAAHKPPPFHGQSLIVQTLLDFLPERLAASEAGQIKLVHINMQFSDSLESIGSWELIKLWRLAKYLVQLAYVRVFKGVRLAYYVPAPAKKIAIFRDVVILGAMRFLGIGRVLHWLAGGLGDYYLELPEGLGKRIVRRAYADAALSIIPAELMRRDASAFAPRRIAKIYNGIQDPCADFYGRVLEARTERLERRNALESASLGGLVLFRVLFMGLCTEDKGLFDAIEAVAAANDTLESRGLALRFHLQVYGKFVDPETKRKFEKFARSEKWSYKPPNAAGPAVALLEHGEFISGDGKKRLFNETDVLYFPSYYRAEATPTVILDALSHGLPVISTAWRGIPELLPEKGLEPCEIRNPSQVTERLLASLDVSNWSDYREEYISKFSLPVFVDKTAAALSEAYEEAGRTRVKQARMVIFAHIPPPVHGQSLMVQSMLEGISKLRASAGPTEFPFRVFHVNARLSSGIDDVGVSSPLKFIRLLRYCFEAMWHRFAHGADILYYIPAPAKTTPIIRDCVAMALLRPVFPKRIYQHRAMGLGLWMKSSGQTAFGRAGRAVTSRLLGEPDLSMVLTPAGVSDSEPFRPRRIVVVPNGKADPCPDYNDAMLPARVRRFDSRSAAVGETEHSRPNGDQFGSSYNMLFLGLCTRSKGLFDALETAEACRQELHRRNRPTNITLQVAGAFARSAEEAQFMRLVSELKPNPDGSPLVSYRGFVDLPGRDRLLRECDLLLFPTFYEGEAMPGVILEAMAYGMDVVTTNWRGVNTLLPEETAQSIDTGDIQSLKEQALLCMDRKPSDVNRRHFLENYSFEKFISRTVDAFLSVA